MWLRDKANEQVPATKANRYTIELERWGITKDIPVKPYTDADFTMAINNVKGINNALQYAYDNEYSVAVLPRGEYAIHYPEKIMMVSHLTFDLNQSTLKVIYDSTRQSPFDTADRSATLDYYNFAGTSIEFANTHYGELTNGKILGCRWDRSYVDPSEKMVEWAYGVAISQGSSFCSVNQCDISGFLGDNVSIGSSALSYYWIGDNQSTRALGKLDYTTGEPVASTTDLTTIFINIPANCNSLAVIGGGYNRRTNLNTPYVDVFFYKEDGTFIGVLKERKILTHIFAPIGAKKLKVRFYDEPDNARHLWVQVGFGGTPHHNRVEYNDIHDGGRGGISFGGSYNIVQGNILRHNAKASDDFMDGVMDNEYLSSTRYHLNQEDSYGDNLVIEKNLIIGGQHGLLIGCYSMHIRDNHFYNCGGAAINLYTIETAVIEGNYIYNCGTPFGDESSLIKAYVSIRGNYIYKGSSILNFQNYEINMYDNTFVNSFLTLISDGTRKFHDNRIINGNLTAKSAYGCTFEATGTSFNTIKIDKLEKCVFKNGKVVLNKQTTDNNEPILLLDCEMKSATISSSNSDVLNTKEVLIKNSVLTDTKVNASAINTQAKNRTVVENCTVEVVSSTTIFESDCNNSKVNNFFELVDSTVRIKNASFASILTNLKSTLSTEMKILNTEFTYTGATPINIQYYPSTNHGISNLYASRNIVNNMTLYATDESKIIHYDPLKETLSGVEPSEGKYRLTQLVPNVDPTAGGYIGWICLTAGYANKNPWAASTSYTVEQKVYVADRVYQCTVAGTSGTVALSHTTGTAVDGTVTWQYLGPKAIFRPYGLIAE